MVPMVWSSVDSAIAIQDASPAAPQDRVSVGTPVTRHLAVHGHFFLKGNPRETFFFGRKSLQNTQCSGTFKSFQHTVGTHSARFFLQKDLKSCNLAALAAPKPVWAETPTTHSATKDDFTVQRCPYPACHGHRSRKSLAPPLLLLPCSSNPFQRHRVHRKMLAFSSTPPVRKKVDFSTSNPGTPVTASSTPSNSDSNPQNPRQEAGNRVASGNMLLFFLAVARYPTTRKILPESGD